MVERALCTGCGACAAVCPRQAVQMREDWEGFYYPVVSRRSCTDCGLCAQVCPLTGAREAGEEASFFAAKAKREDDRLLGSSGGMFHLLAAQVLREGGSVWGAALGEDGTLRHTEAFDQPGLSRLTRTKYIQSDMTPVWRKIRAEAREGRPVLFCGTPCQTDAVRAFLGEERGGVILADLICFGVPSPGLWRRYAAYLEKRFAGALEDVSFRDKRNRDNGHTCAVQAGGTERVWPLSEDLYCRSYFRGVNLRPSCAHCKYCTTERASDITLGDFWGIEGVRPGFDDGMGCSVVICRTQAGSELWEWVQGDAHWFPCRREEAANESQPRLREPTRAHPRRRLYMGLWRVLPFSLWLKLCRRM